MKRTNCYSILKALKKLRAIIFLKVGTLSKEIRNLWIGQWRQIDLSPFFQCRQMNLPPVFVIKSKA